jgi:DNA polymerase-4
MKGIGNSATIRFDVDEGRTAHSCCRLVSVEIKTSELFGYSHQRKLLGTTNITNEIYQAAKELFDEMWKNEKIRHLGVRVSDLCSDEFIQATLFDDRDIDKKQALDKAIDSIRNRYGNFSVFRAVFTDREVPAMEGGSGAEDFPVMSSIL